MGGAGGGGGGAGREEACDTAAEKERDPREWKIQGEMGKQTGGDKHGVHVSVYARARVCVRVRTPAEELNLGMYSINK